MTPKLAWIIYTVVVIAALVAINSWAAVPKHESNSAAPIAAKGAIYRPALWKVYEFNGAPGSVRATVQSLTLAQCQRLESLCPTWRFAR